MKNQAGFTLFEVLIAGVLVLILSTVAFPAYNSYRLHSTVPEGLAALEQGAAQLQESKKSQGVYGVGGCSVSLPESDNFLYHCQLTRGGYGFSLSATGVEKLQGYAYTLDEQGNRRTEAHPKGAPAQACWSVRGTACDYENAAGS
jgi:type IV pilus assembly protein PilE